MKIYNSVSFGVSLVGHGPKVLEEANILAHYKDHNSKTNYPSKTLKESLKIIRDFKPNEKLKVQYDNNTEGYEALLKVISDDKVIFKHKGDEFDFINNLAHAIKTGLLE